MSAFLTLTRVKFEGRNYLANKPISIDDADIAAALKKAGAIKPATEKPAEKATAAVKPAAKKKAAAKTTTAKQPVAKAKENEA